MTRTIRLAAAITLASFATAPAAETHFNEYRIVGDTSQIKVSAAMAHVEAARASSDYIYVQGGYYDGAAGGQTMFVVVTPGDEMVCIFETAPAMEGDGDITLTEAYRVELDGLYENLASVVLPNIQVGDGTNSNNFKIEAAQNGQFTSTWMSVDDPRFDVFSRFIHANRTPCWLFG